MNLETINRSSGAVIAFVLALLLFIAAGVIVKFSINPPSIDAARSAERAKALTEISAVEDKSLNQLGWMDESRGIVRLPVDSAIQLVAQKWQSPAAVRSELNARVEKATAPAAVAPAKPSAFE